MQISIDIYIYMVIIMQVLFSYKSRRSEKNDNVYMKITTSYLE